MEAKHIEFKTMIASVAALLCAEAGLRILFSHSLAALGVVRLLETAFLLSIVQLRGHGVASVGLDRSGFGRGVRRGLIWSAGFAAVCLLILFALLAAGVNALGLLKTPLPAGIERIALFFLVGGIVAPVTEEIFFRGILYGYLRRWGLFPALVLSTILFVLPHLSTQRVPLTQAAGGIVFAAAYEMEKSLMAPIIIHSLGNMAIFTISLLI